MAIMLPSGAAAEWPTMSKKPRGRSLSASSVRRLRDLLCFVLINVVNLSPEDTLRVMQPIDRDHMTKRLRRIPFTRQQALQALLQAGGARHGA